MDLCCDSFLFKYKRATRVGTALNEFTYWTLLVTVHDQILFIKNKYVSSRTFFIGELIVLPDWPSTNLKFCG